MCDGRQPRPRREYAREPIFFSNSLASCEGVSISIIPPEDHLTLNITMNRSRVVRAFSDFSNQNVHGELVSYLDVANVWPAVNVFLFLKKIGLQLFSFGKIAGRLAKTKFCTKTSHNHKDISTILIPIIELNNCN